NLCSLAIPVQEVSYSSVNSRGVFIKCLISCCFLLHKSSTFKQLFDIYSCYCYWKKAYRCKNREATSNIIRNYIGFITFLVSQGTQCTFGLISDSYNAILDLTDTIFLFK